MEISDMAVDLDAAAGIVAHGLLNTMTIIAGAAELLRGEWEVISPGRRAELFGLIETHSAEASQALVAIVHGLSPEALEVLEELTSQRELRAAASHPPVRLRRRRTDS